jgi:predicted ATPase
MDGQIKKRRTLEAIKRIVLRESLNQPLMVVFEDLHWIDGETQGLLDLLADSIGSAKILLLVNYRPEYRHEWGNRTHYTQLRLDPLGTESAVEMLSALLGDGPDLQPLKRLIIERTEGNPFFMEETVQVLLDEGALARNGSVRLTKSLNELKIPATVQAILAARIDRLPANEKDLLQTLAVIGREFPLGLIRRVVQVSDAELDRILSDLQLAEFIYEQPALPEVEYIFKHALTQQVAYNSLLIERRKLSHEHTGQALESMFAGQLDDHLGDLAHHYSRSDNVAKAVEYLGLAGQQAMQRSAYAEATSSLIAAIDLLQRLPDSPERVQRELLLQFAVGTALGVFKGRAALEVERAYTQARELCERLVDPRSFSLPCLVCGSCIYCEPSYLKPMSSGNNSCGWRGARTIRCYRHTRRWLGERPRTLWASSFAPGNISKWRSPSMILSAIGRSSSAMEGLMPGYVACHTRASLCGSSATRTRRSSGAMKRSRWLKGCPILLASLLPNILSACCVNIGGKHALLKRLRRV